MEMPYACSLCCKTFSKNEVLVNHQDSYSMEGPYKCTQCGVNSVQKIMLVLPDRTPNAKSKQKRCLCNRSSDNVGVHAEDFPYICTVCNQHFEEGQDFLRHLSVHDKMTLNQCAWCGRSFSLEMDVTRNWTTGRGDNSSLCVECEKILNVKSSLCYNQTSPKEKKACGCLKNYHRWGKMKAHPHTNGDTAFEPPGEVTTTTTENGCGRNKGKSAIKPKQRYVCTKCGKSCKHKMDLIKHKRIHSWENPYICSECGKCFGQKSSLKFHMQIHRQARSQVFSDQEEMPVCTRIEPVGGKLVQVMFKCDTCECAFTSKDELTQHKRLHENPLRHSLCRKKFHQNLEDTRHKGVCSEENLFGCGDCGKSFGQKVDLFRHQTMHTRPRPYLCSVCGKRFLCSQTYTIHQRIHTGEKPFTCSECGKSFTQKISLVRHERIHTGEKPYSCPKCGKRFARKATMTSHQILHSPEELEIVKIQIL